MALKFGDERPSGVALAPAAVRSSCSFWRQASGRVFYASAEDHFNYGVERLNALVQQARATGLVPGV